MPKVDEIVERLSRYDRKKCPPDSPLVAQDETVQEEDDQQKLTQAEVDEIVGRLTKIDHTYGPPGSSTAQQHLGYNRYDYYHGPTFEVKSRQVTQTEMNDILERLRKPYERRFRGGRGHQGPKTDVRDESEVQQIFERLGKFELKKGPPGSSGGRVHLGYNRFDYGDDKIRTRKGPFRPQEEIDAIIARLTTFDITKYPPGSRGHEKKN